MNEEQQSRYEKLRDLAIKVSKTILTEGEKEMLKAFAMRTNYCPDGDFPTENKPGPIIHGERFSRLFNNREFIEMIDTFDVGIRGVTILGSLNITEAERNFGILFVGCIFRRSHVSFFGGKLKSLIFDQCTIDEDIVVVNTDMLGQFHVTRSNLKGSVFLRKSKIGSDVRIKTTSINKAISLEGSEIQGDVALSNIKYTPDQESLKNAVICRGASIRGSLSITTSEKEAPEHIRGSIDLSNCRVDGDLTIQARIINNQNDAIVGNKETVVGKKLKIRAVPPSKENDLKESEDDIEGHIKLDEISIGENFLISGNGHRDLRVAGNVSLREGKFDNDVSITGLKCHSLDFTKSIFKRNISFWALDIRKFIFLDKCVIDGTAEFEGIECVSVRVVDSKVDALSFSEITAAKFIQLSYSRVNEIYFGDAVKSGEVSAEAIIADEKFSIESTSGIKEGVNLNKARFNDVFKIEDLSSKSSDWVMTLNDAQFEYFDKFADVKSQFLGSVETEGLRYNSLSSQACRYSGQDWIIWFEQISLNRERFSPQTHRKLASSLFKIAKDRDAQDIYISMNRSIRLDYRKRNIEKIRRIFIPGYWFDFQVVVNCITSFGWYVLDLIFDKFSGYGFRPEKTLSWILGLILLGMLLFTLGGFLGVMMPPTKTAYWTECDLLDSYPTYNPILYAIDITIPLIDLHTEKYWHPRWSDEWDLYNIFRYYLGLHIIAGWTLTTLFVTSVTGLIKKE